MTALSARCFLKNNKRKVCLLGFLFLLITICYFGEIYIFDSEKDMLNIMASTRQRLICHFSVKENARLSLCL